MFCYVLRCWLLFVFFVFFFKLSNVQTFKRSNSQTFKRSNFQNFKLSNVQTSQTFKRQCLFCLAGSGIASKCISSRLFFVPGSSRDVFCFVVLLFVVCCCFCRVFKLSNVSNFQTFKLSEFQTFKLSNFSNFQTFQTFKLSNFETLKL